MERRKSKKIKLANTFIGGDSPILVQSMLNIPASDIEGSVQQAKELASAGCQVIRFAIPNEEALNLIEPIKNAVDVPLVADIHFDYKLALGAAERGIDKIRINPGNIGDDSRVKAVADSCRQKNIPIRIGVNSGSLEKHILAKYGSPTPEAMVESALYHANLLEKFDFDDDTTNAPNVLELVAKWDINKYTVQFVSDYGSFADQTVEHGKPIDTDKLTIPEVEGYTFDGWYTTNDTHSTKFDFSTPITGDTTVYAKWEKNAPVLPDTYELNVSGAFVYVDGVDVTASAGDTSLQLEKDASVRLVADPDRMPSGMVFDRWTILNGALNADDAEKFEPGRTLEEFPFTMPAEPLSIEATPRMQEEEGSDTVSVIAGVTLGTAATALVAWQAYDLGMSLYQEHWLPADFVMPKTRAELALLLWNTAGRPAPAAQPAFTDITDPDTAQAAQWAVETGLMTPKSADRFKPEKSVTRWKAVRSWKRVTNQNT